MTDTLSLADRRRHPTRRGRPPKYETDAERRAVYLEQRIAWHHKNYARWGGTQPPAPPNTAPAAPPAKTPLEAVVYLPPRGSIALAFFTHR